MVFIAKSVIGKALFYGLIGTDEMRREQACQNVSKLNKPDNNKVIKATNVQINPCR